jgi:hypothetical protein
MIVKRGMKNLDYARSTSAAKNAAPGDGTAEKLKGMAPDAMRLAPQS